MPETIKFDKVADIYDYYVNIGLDIPFFLKETENHNERILELMCGTGRVSLPLLENERKLTCVDYSQGMLNAFEKKISGRNYPVDLINMDVTKLNLNEKFKLILLPFHSLSEILSADKQKEALKKISEHMDKDGIFICTLQNPKVRLKTADGVTRILGKFPMADDKTMIVSYMNQINQGIVSGFQFYEIYDSSNRMIEKRYLEINFRPIEDTEFREMISGLGLKIQNVYGDYAYSEFDEEKSGFMIYKIAKMPYGKPRNLL
jgi:ubiquinone/menaquinone biosynthesis C-methylase UbiE